MSTESLGLRDVLVEVPEPPTESNCLSIKSDGSQGRIRAKKRKHSGSSDSEESTTSSVSLKSDRSKEYIMNFKGWQDRTPSPTSSYSSDAADGAGSPHSGSEESTTSSVSLKSDMSKKDIINFKEE